MDLSLALARPSLRRSWDSGCKLDGPASELELEDREKTYGLFVEEAVHLFVDSIQQSAIDAAKIMRLYSKVTRIRLTSNDRVLSAAEEVGRRLFEAHERPPGNPIELLARYANGDESLDPLREFTEACREERATALE